MGNQPHKPPRYYAHELVALLDRALARVPAHLRAQTVSHIIADLSHRNQKAALGGET